MPPEAQHYSSVKRPRREVIGGPPLEEMKQKTVSMKNVRGNRSSALFTGEASLNSGRDKGRPEPFCRISQSRSWTG